MVRASNCLCARIFLRESSDSIVSRDSGSITHVAVRIMVFGLIFARIIHRVLFTFHSFCIDAHAIPLFTKLGPPEFSRNPCNIFSVKNTSRLNGSVINHGVIVVMFSICVLAIYISRACMIGGIFFSSKSIFIS